ncbi:MBL fold metallo-hydrolase [Gracilibacillus alcaliphilus]|uniref:MBL fold metallo-hydrolase n=1 Tax=Gracilibacillus alcaliphilus TaxID=1401441 RepID=UPI00195C2F28|nr:MBL fold metallo-hydrolase [Gracilibacillus alcaliphilus]MBM7677467.1 phosphoribosyl 1,2-cyclic phosphate phosphodiesterase [Gracilibacillus alcaliphilus]
MKLTYLGTGAAERVPAIFCKCRVCDHARQKQGKEIRTQSQFLLDDGKLMIDFPGDAYLHMMKHHLNYNDIEYLLISHWHSDHLYPEDLVFRLPYYSAGLDKPLHIYGNEAVKELYDRVINSEGGPNDHFLQYHTIQPFQKFEVNGYTIYPFPARHGMFEQDSFNFAISDGRDTLLTTHDSGYPYPETFDYLEQEKVRLTLVSLDCTSQTKGKNESHMNWEHNQELIQELRARNLCTEDTIFVANHFSHNGGLTHKEMAALTEQAGVITSYDGLEIDTALR